MCLEITDSQYPITFFTGTSTSRTAQECVAAKIQHTQKQERRHRDGAACILQIFSALQPNRRDRKCHVKTSAPLTHADGHEHDIPPGGKRHLDCQQPGRLHRRSTSLVWHDHRHVLRRQHLFQLFFASRKLVGGMVAIPIVAGHTSKASARRGFSTSKVLTSVSVRPSDCSRGTNCVRR